MITRLKGNVLSVSEGIIVHGCNCLGVMGAGVAAEVRRRYPKAYETYVSMYETEGLRLGDIHFVPVEYVNNLPTKVIVNAMTQQNVGTHTRQVNYEAIATVFERVVYAQKEHTLHLPIYFPRIGAGLAGGDWEIIEKIIDKTISDSIPAYLVEYDPMVIGEPIPW